MKTQRYETGLMDSMAVQGRRIGSDQQIRMVIHFRNRIDLTLMEKTLHAITYRDPVLGCHFVQEEGKRYFERNKDIDTETLCEVIETEDGESAVMKFIAEEVDQHEVPHLRVGVIRTPKSDILCLRVNHVLADGGGTKEIAYLIADTYKKLSENSTIEFTMEKYKPRTIVGLLESNGSFIPLENTVENPWENFGSFKTVFELPTADNGSEDPAYALRVINPEDFTKLKHYGKRYHATINDLILTALARTLCKVSQIPEGMSFSLQVSSDTRAKLSKEIKYTICNLFGIHFPELCCHREESFEDTLAVVVESMNEIRKNTLNLDIAVKEELAIMRMMKEEVRAASNSEHQFEYGNWPGKTTHIILSNFTIIDEKRLDFGVSAIEDAYEVGTISYGRELMLCASTYNNRLTLSTGFCHSNIEQFDIDKIMDAIKSELYIGIMND